MHETRWFGPNKNVLVFAMSATYAVMQCLSVRLVSVTFVYCAEILKLFSTRYSHSILVFRTKPS